MKCLDDFVGIPYVPGGRDWSGLDCYGLMRLALLELFYVELPLMPTGAVTTHGLTRALTLGTKKLTETGNLQSTTPDQCSPQSPLIGVSWHNGIAVHCGLLLGLRFLHSSESTKESVVQRFDHYRKLSGPMECYQWHK